MLTYAIVFVHLRVSSALDGSDTAHLAAAQVSFFFLFLETDVGTSIRFSQPVESNRVACFCEGEASHVYRAMRFKDVYAHAVRSREVVFRKLPPAHFKTLHVWLRHSQFY